MHVISRPNYMYISIFMGMGTASMTAKTTFSTFVSFKQLNMLNKIVFKSKHDLFRTLTKWLLYLHLTKP